MLAADCGADGVIVSNHGGRAVDSTRAPIEVLPEVVDAVGKRITVLVDSGFRRGADVVQGAGAGRESGADRPRARSTAPRSRGEAGAARAIEIYRDEIDRLLALIGCPGIAHLGREYLASPAGMDAGA